MIKKIGLIGVLICGIAYAQTKDTAHLKLPKNAIRLVELPVLFQQTAAEYRALCYQAFNLATLRLNLLSKKELRRHPAIVTDLDETILDNGAFDAQLVLEDTFYTEKHWQDYVAISNAPALPGAVDFLKAASKKGVTIFYISNRSTDNLLHTLANLQNLGLPNADTAHMLFAAAGISSKEERRQQVLQKHNIILLLGDNLNDFSAVFENKNIADRFAETDKLRTEWGKKFIVLPNPTYGDWESAIYQYKHGLTDEQKERLRIQALKGY